MKMNSIDMSKDKLKNSKKWFSIRLIILVNIILFYCSNNVKPYTPKLIMSATINKNNMIQQMYLLFNMYADNIFSIFAPVKLSPTM